MHWRHSLFLAACCLGIGACGGGSPVAPLPPVQAGGLWSGTTRLSGVGSIPCTEVDYWSLLGDPVSLTLAVTQSGSDLAATLTDTSTGSRSGYSGTAGEDSITLNWTYSEQNTVTVSCPGRTWTWRLRSGRITATISGNRASGTQTFEYSANDGSTVSTIAWFEVTRQ